VCHCATYNISLIMSALWFFPSKRKIFWRLARVSMKARKEKRKRRQSDSSSRAKKMLYASLSPRPKIRAIILAFVIPIITLPTTYPIIIIRPAMMSLRVIVNAPKIKTERVVEATISALASKKVTTRCFSPFLTFCS
jgi:hypothetical protein